ncbi:35023_t:CDS:2, partial [Racocetra persica]
METMNESHVKLCKNCNIEKPLDYYYKYKNSYFGKCKECTLAQQRARIQTPEGREKRKATTVKYEQSPAEQIRAKNKKYQPIANQKAVERRKNDPAYKIAAYQRCRMRIVLKGISKSAGTLELIGCSLDYLKAWFDYQFQPSMTWDNYGAYWEIDHVRPCSSFDLNDTLQQKECFGWKNLRPLQCSRNRSKNKYIDTWDLICHEIIECEGEGSETKWLSNAIPLFDGDQMNLWIPRNPASRAEALLMSGIANWFISTKTSGPVNGQ